MRIGFAKVAVTPPVGIMLEGYGDRLESSRCIYDDLYVKCISFEIDSDRHVSIVSADLIGVPYSVYIDIKDKIKKLGNIEVFLGVTHSHASPAPVTDDLYRDYFVKSVVGCIKASINNVKDVSQIVVGRGFLPQVVYNRRKPLGGAVDPEVVALDLGVVSIVNFTAHPVILGPDNLCISSDYPGAVERFLRYLSGKEAVYLNGCCGNINPYTFSTDLSKPYDRRGGKYYEVERYGKVIALEALKSLELGEKIDLSRCAIDYRTALVELKLRKEIVEFIEKIDIDKLGDELRKHGIEQDILKLRVAKMLINEIKGLRILPTPVAVLKICDSIAMVFLPAEVFVEHQLYIKSRSPFKHTIVSCYFNSYWMYIPTIEAFSEGGYEVEVPISIIEPGEGEKLREKMIELLAKLS